MKQNLPEIKLFNKIRYYSNIVSWKFCSIILYIIAHLPLHTTYAKTDHPSDHFHYFSCKQKIDWKKHITQDAFLPFLFNKKYERDFLLFIFFVIRAKVNFYFTKLNTMKYDKRVVVFLSMLSIYYSMYFMVVIKIQYIL